MVAMWNVDPRPSWFNRMAHSIGACLVGFVAGVAIFERSRFPEAIGAPAAGLAVLYSVGAVVYWFRKRRDAANAEKPSGA